MGGRCIVRHEGLMIGGSCGATMAGAYRFIKENNIGADKRVAVLFADSSRNYMSKFLDDAWMEKEGFNTSDVTNCPKVDSPITIRGHWAARDTFRRIASLQSCLV